MRHSLFLCQAFDINPWFTAPKLQKTLSESSSEEVKPKEDTVSEAKVKTEGEEDPDVKPEVEKSGDDENTESDVKGITN